MVIVVLLGAFALVSTTALNVDAASNQPILRIKVSNRVIEVVDGVTDHWFYVTNTLRSTDRDYVPPYAIHHVVELTDLDLTIVYPDGTDDVMNQDLHLLLPARWNPIIKPGETVLVFYVGFTQFTQTGMTTFIYTLEYEYEDSTYIFEETIRIRVSE
jgi:hypothetical protein